MLSFFWLCEEAQCVYLRLHLGLKSEYWTTTNLRTKDKQNLQKIELYGSLTTKELKRKHSSRLVGGTEVGSQEERTHSKVLADCRLGGTTFACR